jgi:hypothetical protein
MVATTFAKCCTSFLGSFKIANGAFVCV